MLTKDNVSIGIEWPFGPAHPNARESPSNLRQLFNNNLTKADLYCLKSIEFRGSRTTGLCLVMFFRPSLFDVIANYARWHRMFSGLTTSTWMVIYLDHLISHHTRKMLERVRSCSFFCAKKFLEKIFEKWCYEC